MKNHYIIILISILFTNVYGQTPEHRGAGKWYNFLETIYDEIPGNKQYYSDHIFPDTLVKAKWGNDYYGAWNHSIGQGFDPKSDWFKSDKLSGDQSFRVDSVRFPYKYKRHHDSNDTLVIQMFDNTGWMVYDGPYGDHRYANAVLYDYTKRKGEKPVKEIIHILTADDENTSRGFLSFPINHTYDKGHEVAFTVTYFPGHKYENGDTLDMTDGNVNMFEVFRLWEAQPIKDSAYYNHELLVTTNVRYNLGNWKGQYIPGNFWKATESQHMDVSFQLSILTGTSDVANNSPIQLFPNPVAQGTEVRLNANGLAIEKVEIYDLNGKLISAHNALKNVLPTDPLDKGLYMVNIYADGVCYREKILVQ